MQKSIVTLGEIMLRLSTKKHRRFTQCNHFDVNFGGGEVNVAEALCHYGCKSKFISKIPENPIGQMAINRMRKYGIDTDAIVRGGNRLGVYFLEQGASMRASKVIYDREDSSLAKARVEDFDFDAQFKEADWFHSTGITPALGENAADITETAFKKAKEHGLTTSFDLNYRQKLWGKEEARKAISRLCPYIDVLIGVYVGEDKQEETLLGFKSNLEGTKSGKVSINRYKDIFGQLKDKYNFKYIASTFRETLSASDNSLSAMVYDGKEYHISKKQHIRIVDRIGGGDSFASGLIYALMNDMNTKDATEFAISASALKHTIPGDFNHVTQKEVKDWVDKLHDNMERRDIFYRV